MDEGLNTLFEMADIDAKIYKLRKTLDQIPKKIAEARRQLDAEKLLLEELKTPWDELHFQIEEKESTIQVALDTITKFEEHMKIVTTQKEYMAARKQVDEARKLNEKLQNEILDRRVQQEEIAPKLAEVQKRYDAVNEGFQEKETSILKEKNKTAKEMVKKESQIKSLSDKIESRFWLYYQRLIKGGKTPAIVPAASGTCGGCHMTIPPQEYNLCIAKPEELHTCAFCSRIIFHKPADPIINEEAPAEMASST